MGLFGAALFLGDSMITPAISVLSAVEGLKVVDPSFADWVVPITVVIIVVLFAAQRFGTAAVGRLFGPVMIGWFAAIGACGVWGITKEPDILKALSPTYAVGFLVGHFQLGVLRARRRRAGRHRSRGAVRRHGPLRRRPDLGGVDLPGVPGLHAELSGPGRADSGEPANISAPFFLLTPDWARMPMVLLATARRR